MFIRRGYPHTCGLAHTVAVLCDSGFHPHGLIGDSDCNHLIMHLKSHGTPHHSTLYHTTPHHTTPQNITPHYTTLHYTTLHHTTLYHTTPHYTTLHHDTLHHALNKFSGYPLYVQYMQSVGISTYTQKCDVHT